MRKTGIFIVLIVLGLASLAMAAVSGDSNFRTRYNTTSTTPITDINYLNGVTSNVQDQLDATTSSSLADTKVNVGQSTGLAAAKSISLTGPVTGTLANSGAIATSLTANSVGTSTLFTNAVPLTIAAGATYNTVTVDTDHFFMGHYVSTIGSYNSTTIANIPVYEGSGVWKISLPAAIGPNPVTFTLNFVDAE